VTTKAAVWKFLVQVAASPLASCRNPRLSECAAM
jgi:hypothetical protein